MSFNLQAVTGWLSVPVQTVTTTFLPTLGGKKETHFRRVLVDQFSKFQKMSSPMNPQNQLLSEQIFQLQKRLYNHQCLFICLSVHLLPKPSNSLKSFSTTQHHSTAQLHTQHHITTSQQTITHNITSVPHDTTSHTLSQPSASSSSISSFTWATFKLFSLFASCYDYTCDLCMSRQRYFIFSSLWTMHSSHKLSF